MAWYIIKPWLDISTSRSLIYHQAMAWYVIKPWLDMISSQGLIYYQAMAWYINKPWLDLLSNHGLIYYQTMAWYVFKPWLDMLLSSHLSSHGLITHHKQAMAWSYIIIKPQLDTQSSHGLIRYQAVAWYVISSQACGIDLVEGIVFLETTLP